MKLLKIWMLSAILIFCGLMVFTSCSNNDDEIPEPTIEGLRDGVMQKTTRTVHATSWLWEPEVPGSRRQWLQLRQVT